MSCHTVSPRFHVQISWYLSLRNKSASPVVFPTSALRTSYQVRITAGQYTSAAVMYLVPLQQPTLCRVTHINSQKSVRHSVTNRILAPCKGLYEINHRGGVKFVRASQQQTLIGDVSSALASSRPWSATFRAR